LLKQSSKVVTYGQHTLGMMDYEGMSNRTELPYRNYYLYIPISQSSWTAKHPIDETGFSPQVILHDPKILDRKGNERFTKEVDVRCILGKLF
jgi:hypothetical protein